MSVVDSKLVCVTSMALRHWWGTFQRNRPPEIEWRHVVIFTAACISSAISLLQWAPPTYSLPLTSHENRKKSNTHIGTAREHTCTQCRPFQVFSLRAMAALETVKARNSPPRARPQHNLAKLHKIYRIITKNIYNIIHDSPLHMRSRTCYSSLLRTLRLPHSLTHSIWVWKQIWHSGH